MPDDEIIPAPPNVEQVLAVHTDAVKGWVGSESDPDAKVEVVVLSLYFQPRGADPTDEPMQTLIILPAEDARELQAQLAVAHETETVAAQVSE